MNYQQHGAGGLGAAAEAAGAGRPSAAPVGASQGPQGRAHVMGNTMPEEMMRRVFELGHAAMMREDQEARDAAASESATATATAAAQLMTPQQLAMNASGATARPTGAGTEEGAEASADESGAAARRRTESPPKAATTDVEDTTPWPTKYFRTLSAQSVLVQARLNGLALTEIFAGTVVITTWPGEQWLSVARNCCRGATGMRSARVNSWRDPRLGALVLTKMLVSYVMGTDMPATDMEDLEKMRDGLIRALPWAFDVHAEDDDDWPEPGQHSTSECDASLVARRLAWFEGVLRLTFAARRDRERLVRYMIAKGPEDTQLDSGQEEKAPTGLDAVVMEHFGVDVAIAQMQLAREIIVLERDDTTNHGPGSDAPLVKGAMISVMTARCLRHLRNALTRHGKAAVVASRTADVQRTKLGTLELVDDSAKEGAPAVFIKLDAAHRLDATAGTRNAGEMYLKAARTGDATVRLVDEAVRRAATSERTEATEFAHAVLESGAESADHLETFERLIVALSPVRDDARLATSAKMAWVRSSSSEDMVRAVERRLAQLVAKSTPGTVRRDSTQSSPARKVVRITTDVDDERKELAEERRRLNAAVAAHAAMVARVPMPALHTAAAPAAAPAAQMGWQPPSGMSMPAGYPAAANAYGAPAAAGPTLAEALLRMNRQRYGGSAVEDDLIDRFNEIGAGRVTTDMALAARSALPGDVMHDNAGMDMKLRDTTTPVGVARKIEVVAADLRLNYFFPGEPQLVLLMHGKVSRNDGFKPFMFQRNRAFAEKRSGVAHTTVDVASSNGTLRSAAVRNLPPHQPVENMEQWESMVDGLGAAAAHMPAELVDGMETFFSIQRKHYDKTHSKLKSMTWSKIYTDFLDRCDSHASSVDERALNLRHVVPRWCEIPAKLSERMLLREDKLAEIADELGEERAARGANVAPSAQATAAARTAAATAADAERARASKEDKAAARKLKQAEAKAAKKVVADAKRAASAAGGAGGGGAGGGGAGGAGGKGKRGDQPCFNFQRDGSCIHGDGCHFSHDPATCDKATAAAPTGVEAKWMLKWTERKDPQRGSDPAARVHGSKKIYFTGILAKDRWEICHQTAHKCFKRHVECNTKCRCPLCSKPDGKKWPELVDADLMPAGHPDK